ncbi:MAG: hypothetical protein BWK80_41835 [Desulfobacteraceae bacterium IS3]|nr:MAG: hypothetical protein BWK80_41835 [Desulfobacteraceae bacterium IS3]
MKKKIQGPKLILERAEKLFKKGSYALAKPAFEEINAVLQDEDIAEKIKICEKEITLLETKELIRKGRRSLKKGNLRDAIQYFEEAYRLSGEEWLPEKISSLKAEMAGRKSFEAAKDAEQSGDYEKAAELYEEAISVNETESKEILLRRAHILVKAGKYEEAVSIFGTLNISDERAVYDYGFALAKIKKYYDCLKVWDALPEKNNTFSEQKKAVRSLLAADLYECFENSKRCVPKPGLGNEDKGGIAQWERIYEQGKYLTDTAGDKELSGLTEYARYSLAGDLWKTGQYDKVRELLLPYPSQMNAGITEAYAKLFFRLAEMSREYLTEFTLFWLTALYSPETYIKLAPDETRREKTRQALIQKGEDLIKKKYPDCSAALACWKAEKKAVETLHSLAAGKPFPVGTPRFIKKFGGSEPILEMIRNNREFFSDTELYLSTGAYYSSAGQSLFHLHNRNYEEVFEGLPISDKAADEFVSYCIERVYFEYGLYCLEKGEPGIGRYFETAAALFEKSPEYEKTFIDKAMSSDHLHEMQWYENALAYIYAKRPVKKIGEALSIIMARRAIRMQNRRQLSLRSTEAVLKKALKLHTDNELARTSLESMQAELDLEDLIRAIEKHKINKACQIAVKSQHREVKEEFLDFIRYNVEHLDDPDIKDRERLFLLNDFAKWCARVDESHPLMKDIDKRLEALK